MLWPMPGTTISSAPAMLSAVSLAPATGRIGSSAPCRTRAGQRTVFKSALRGLAAISAADWRASPAGSYGPRSTTLSAKARICAPDVG
jgi:hypothetical protein